MGIVKSHKIGLSLTMSRPYRRESIESLERRLAMCDGDIKELNLLREELLCRSTDRASRCLATVEGKLAIANSVTGTSGSSVQPPRRGVPPTENRFEDPAAEATPFPPPQSIQEPPLEPYPPIGNSPVDILSSWIAMEVLSPQIYRKPETLAGDGGIAYFSRGLPWARGESSRPQKKLFYQVVFGAAKMDVALTALFAKYGDSRVEHFPTQANVPLAVLLVDKSGIPVEPLSIGLSSFAWGVSTALKANLSKLSDWKEVEIPFTGTVERYLRDSLSDKNGKFRALDHGTIAGVFDLLCRTIGLPSEFFEPPSFAIRTFVYFRDKNPPELMLLNSFFLSDLLEARRAVDSKTVPANLKRYLGISPPAQPKIDLLEDIDARQKAVSPTLTPLARWPSKGRHPLVFLQQAAVNLALSECAEGGLVGVNGPPGTGKTTLLRDLVTAIVTERAMAMARFDDPIKAFSQTSHSVKIDGSTIYLHELDPTLKGFEMLVASSNNKAVENVSAELPTITAIAEDAIDLRYFSTLASSLFRRDAWGTVAAVLGNRKNQFEFREGFWRDDDIGFNNYLFAAEGGNPQVPCFDASGNPSTRKPRIIEEENPPTTRAEALKRWAFTRDNFNQALARSREWHERLLQLEHDVAQVTTLETNVRFLEDKAAAEERALAGFRADRVHADVVESNARQLLSDAVKAYTEHLQAGPGFWARLFRTKRWKAWHSIEQELLATRKSKDASAKEISTQIEQLAFKINQSTSVFNAVTCELDLTQQLLRETNARLASARAEGVQPIDGDFLASNRETINLAVPWFPKDAQRARDDLFVAAMALHRAFVDASAKPLRQNLNALIGVAALKAMKDADKQRMVPTLWSSLFLVVPLVSTTFASVNQMLGKLPAESLGWLFVDEAGQALPQAMVGALMKTRRAVVVGDPIQLEPITALPDQLTTAIFRRFGVDPETYAPPNGSAQTLTDLRSKFTAEFPTEHGSRTVGIPLLVHRRCSEPMFSVSNWIAYAGLMVQAKKPQSSSIVDTLGPSAWIHIEGHGLDKWCPAEGGIVLELLQKLANSPALPDLYIISPFVIVEHRLRDLIRQSGILRTWIPDREKQSEWLRERVGTVHTVQGREAEAVILVLGAPEATQVGARNWAGGRPNLLNVAVTRAKAALYVVGNRRLWKQAGCFSKLSARMPE
jgi:hypothetical protein